MTLQPLLPGNVSLALAAAVTWGGGDFSGGMATKRGGGSLRTALRVVLTVHLSSLIGLLVAVSLRHDSAPTGRLLLWALVAGVCAGTCIIAFYVCLARGAMGATAAISGLLAAAIPTVVSIVREGSPGASPLIGFALAAAAIWLIAAAPRHAPTPTSTLLLAVISGIGFGLYFVALRLASPAGVLWPLALSRCASIAVCVLGLLWAALASQRRKVHQAEAKAPATPWLSAASLRWAAATAILDTAGNLFYIAATRGGRLDIAAVLASLYPASTILLAGVILRERVNARQGIGMALAATAVVLITR